MKIRKNQAARSLFVGLGLLVILAAAGCNGTQDKPVQQVPSQATKEVILAPTPTVAAYVPDPTHPMMDKIWQPAEPKKRVEMSANPTEVADSPDALIVYEVVGLGLSYDMKISTDGLVSVYGARDTVASLKLPSERLQSLLARFDKANFFNLDDKYIESDPDGVIRELSYVTVTYNKDGRSKSVTIRGSSLTPGDYIQVEHALRDLDDEVRTKGEVFRRPDPLVDYYLDGSGYTWWLDVDVEGGLYYGNDPTPVHMSADDLQSLHALLNGISNLGSDEWFTAPDDVRDIIFMDEHRAIITTYTNGSQSQWINALSGATVPEGLETLLQKLAEIYDKYAPAQ